jgi:hypothetical protein
MANNIVQVNVSQTVSPAPSKLQRTGALVSQGGTNTAPGTTTLLTSAGDLASVLRAPAAISTLTWSGGTVTVTTAAPHGLGNGDVLNLTIAGAAPSAYNGLDRICTVTGSSTFTYALASDPGTMTAPGTWAPLSVSELTSMVNTFFAQGVGVSVYILELGAIESPSAMTALSTFITSSPTQIFYAYLVPRAWAWSNPDYANFLAAFESTTSKTYFFTTMTTGNYTYFDSTMKCVIGLIEAPLTPVTEFSLAAAFYVWLNNDPSTTNKVAPFAFRYVLGVTPYPLRGNGALFTTLKAASINWIGTGAEGGISNTILLWGTTKDGRDATYWYSVDWVQINIDLDLSNEIINGSNNPINPLYYNQEGINRLQVRAQSTMNRGISYGLVLAPVDVDAVGFGAYVIDNPNDYAIGKYAGLSVSYTPARGFTQIVFNVNVTDFPTV